MAIIKKIKLPNEVTARDIGANSSNIIYDGDAGATTTLNEKIQSIFTAIGDINSFEIAIVNELPATGDDHTIYFVPESEGSTSHNEYMYIDNQWELIGTTTIDLSNYLQKNDIAITQGLTTGVPAATVTIDGTSTTIYSVEDSDEKLKTEILPKNGIMKPVILGNATTTPQTKYYSSNLEFSDTENNKSILTVGQESGRNGQLRLKSGSGSRFTDLVTTYSLSGDNTITLPDTSGTLALTTDIPSVTVTQGITTGTAIGSIDINGTTTTFYAPEDTKVKQNDITGSTTGVRPILLSAQSSNKGTITDESLKSDTFLFYKGLDSLIIRRSSSDDFDGRVAITDSAGKAQAEILSYKEGTTTQIGVGLISAGNNQPSGTAGNAKGIVQIYSENTKANTLESLATTITYNNYLPMVDQAILAAGVTTGVGSSTVPVYMASTGELIACSLPAPVTPPTYSLSMTGPTIFFTSDQEGEVSRVTLPIWDGTLD